MAYTPINWQTGDTITAEKLNKMDNGWGTQNNSVTHYSGSITTENWGNYSGAEVDIDNKITAESITVTFDGVTYNVTASSDGDYGAPYNGNDVTYDFTSIPFNISSNANPVTGTTKMSIVTSSDGTYSVVVQSIDVSIETSANFSAAVNSCVDTTPFKITLDKTTFQEAADAFNAGRLVYAFSNLNRLYLAVMINETEFKITCITIMNTSTINVGTIVAQFAGAPLTIN